MRIPAKVKSHWSIKTLISWQISDLEHQLEEPHNVLCTNIIAAKMTETKARSWKYPLANASKS